MPQPCSWVRSGVGSRWSQSRQPYGWIHWSLNCRFLLRGSGLNPTELRTLTQGPVSWAAAGHPDPAMAYSQDPFTWGDPKH